MIDVTVPTCGKLAPGPHVGVDRVVGGSSNASGTWLVVWRLRAGRGIELDGIGDVDDVGPTGARIDVIAGFGQR